MIITRRSIEPLSVQAFFDGADKSPGGAALSLNRLGIEPKDGTDHRLELRLGGPAHGEQIINLDVDGQGRQASVAQSSGVGVHDGTPGSTSRHPHFEGRKELGYFGEGLRNRRVMAVTLPSELTGTVGGRVDCFMKDLYYLAPF